MLARAVLAVIALALLVSCESYKRSDSGVSATEKTLLYDFRDTTKSGPPKLDPAIERKVLSSISPSYYTYANNAGCLKVSNQAVVLQILAVVHGSFTAPVAQETAYVVERLTCSEILRSSNLAEGVNRLVVFAADRPVASADIPEIGVARTSDLNRDGKNELLLAGWDGANTTARLVQFDNANLATVENFGIVSRDACGPPAQTARIMDAVVLSYLPRPNRQMPSFTAERFRAECPAPGQPPRWTQVSR